MWIRSQDDSLVKCEAIFISNVEKLKLYGVTGNDGFFLGEYSTEERATEVLDEIHTRINHASGTVYQMPEK